MEELGDVAHAARVHFDTKELPSPYGYGREEVRLEYERAHTDYCQQVVTRFTIAGFYIAGIGFLVQAALNKDASWIVMLVTGIVGLIISICVWILELRTRSLYHLHSRRMVDIERIYWGLNGPRDYEGLVSITTKIPPVSRSRRIDPDPLEDLGRWRRVFLCALQRSTIFDDGRRPRYEPVTVSWLPDTWVIKDSISKRITYSLAFDILYPTLIIFWFSLILYCLIIVALPLIIFPCLSMFMTFMKILVS